MREDRCCHACYIGLPWPRLTTCSRTERRFGVIQEKFPAGIMHETHAGFSTRKPDRDFTLNHRNLKNDAPTSESRCRRQKAAGGTIRKMAPMATHRTANQNCAAIRAGHHHHPKRAQSCQPPPCADQSNSCGSGRQARQTLAHLTAQSLHLLVHTPARSARCRSSSHFTPTG